MSDLSSLMQACIDAKQGDKDFALFYADYNKTWSAHIGSPSSSVGLGEVCGEYHTDGQTPEEAVRWLLHGLTTGKPPNKDIERVYYRVDGHGERVYPLVAELLNLDLEYVRAVLGRD